MKILLAPIEIAGQVAITANALRKLGLNAVSSNYHFHKNPYEYACDVNFKVNRELPVTTDDIKKFMFTFMSVFRFDIFHFNFGKTLLKKNRDLPILKHLGKKLVMEFWGSDIRMTDTSEQEPNASLARKSRTKIIEKLKRLGSNVHLAIVADLELKAYVENFFKRVELVPQRIELDKFQPSYPDPTKQTPLVVHAPTHRAIKGTDYLIEAVENLKSKHSFDFRLIEGMKHSEAKKLYENADVIVDQLRLGTYGVFAVESMALGKPVITYIHEDFKRSYPPNLPIQTATINSIGDVLERILTDGDLRHNLGIQSRKYAEDHHDSIKVAKKLFTIYQSL